jgi:hypothetical protein
MHASAAATGTTIDPMLATVGTESTVWQQSYALEASLHCLLQLQHSRCSTWHVLLTQLLPRLDSAWVTVRCSGAWVVMDSVTDGTDCS